MKSTATFLFACLIGAAFAPSASAQGLDDLFSASPQRDTPQRAAQRLELPPMPVASADAEEIAQPQSSPSDRQLARSSGSSAEDTATLAKQLRQARALEASRQRQARLEASYWASNPNLRPNWDSNLGQNYRNRIVYYVPVYVRAR